jgi:hypothetical protein
MGFIDESFRHETVEKQESLEKTKASLTQRAIDNFSNAENLVEVVDRVKRKVRDNFSRDLTPISNVWIEYGSDDFKDIYSSQECKNSLIIALRAAEPATSDARIVYYAGTSDDWPFSRMEVDFEPPLE